MLIRNRDYSLRQPERGRGLLKFFKDTDELDRVRIDDLNPVNAASVSVTEACGSGGGVIFPLRYFINGGEHRDK